MAHVAGRDLWDKYDAARSTLFAATADQQAGRALQRHMNRSRSARRFCLVKLSEFCCDERRIFYEPLDRKKRIEWHELLQSIEGRRRRQRGTQVLALPLL